MSGKIKTQKYSVLLDNWRSDEKDDAPEGARTDRCQPMPNSPSTPSPKDLALYKFHGSWTQHWEYRGSLPCRLGHCPALFSAHHWPSSALRFLWFRAGDKNFVQVTFWRWEGGKEGENRKGGGWAQIIVRDPLSSTSPTRVLWGRTYTTELSCYEQGFCFPQVCPGVRCNLPSILGKGRGPSVRRRMVTACEGVWKDNTPTLRIVRPSRHLLVREVS